MAKRCVCEGCNKGCRYGVEHTWEQTYSGCMPSPSCISAGPIIPCDLCNGHFRIQTCFDNHKKKRQGIRQKKKSTRELRKCCGTCGAFTTHKRYECNKRFCATCYENKEFGHLYFMHPLVNVPASSEHVLYVLYDFETTQDRKRTDKSNEHVLNLVCLQQFCSKCENISDVEQDCIQC